VTDASPAPSRSVWLVVWGALTMAPLFYGFLAPMVAPGVTPSQSLELFRNAFLALGVGAASVGTLVMSKAASSAGNLAAPAAFQLKSVIAMALFESVAICGVVLTVLGAPPSQVWYWGGASVALQVAFALPSGLGYWREWERVEAGAPGGTR
jgi:hypothetical protein